MAGTSPAMTKMNHTHVVRNSLKRGPLFDSEERPLGRVSKDDMAHGLAAILRDAARSARLLRMRSKQVLLPWFETRGFAALLTDQMKLVLERGRKRISPGRDLVGRDQPFSFLVHSL